MSDLLLINQKSLSKTNDDIYKDIAEVEETLRYLNGQNEIIKKQMNSGTVMQRFTRKEMLHGIERIVIEPSGELIFKLKAFEQIEKLLEKYRHFIF